MCSWLVSQSWSEVQLLMPLLSSTAIISLPICPAMERQHWKRKSGMTKPLKFTKPLTPNTCTTALNLLIGSPPTQRSKNRQGRTPQILITLSNSTTKHTLTSQWHHQKNLLFLSTQWEEETNRVAFYGRQHARSWLCSFSFSLNFWDCYHTCLEWTPSSQKSTTAPKALLQLKN